MHDSGEFDRENVGPCFHVIASNCTIGSKLASRCAATKVRLLLKWWPRRRPRRSRFDPLQALAARHVNREIPMRKRHLGAT